jgi:predicted SAM-dependent methyltransferase
MATVDLVFSQAVLEHVRRHELAPTLRETFRLLKPEGLASHEVDLKDHLGGALNNLRFSERLWEADWMARSGFYTNRVQFNEICKIFDRSGFDVELVKMECFRALPTPRQKLSGCFRSLPDDDLLVSSFHALLRPRKT